MYKYPIGPLSLVQLEYAKAAVRYRQRHGWIGEDVDPYAVGVDMMVRFGIYPTFGHIDVRTRRWYRDLWGARTQEIGIIEVA